MSDSPHALASLLGEAHPEFLRRFGAPSVFLAQTQNSHWPAFLTHAMWRDLPLLDSVCPGTVDVTRGHIAQYRIDGVSPSRCVEDLQLAVRLPKLRARLPGAHAWMDDLEQELGLVPGSAKLNAFVNPAGVGLGAHCDPSEHLLIHVAGEKRIRVHPNPAGPFVTASHALPQTPRPQEYAQYVTGLPDWDTLPSEAEEILLRPGSVLLLPRGVFHETVGAGAGPSATVVVQFNLPNYADLVLEYLRPYLLQDARWRTPVGRALDGRGEASVDDTLAGLLDELGRRLPGLSRPAIRDCHARAPDQTLGPATRVMHNPAVLVETQPEGIAITPLRGKGQRTTFKLGADAVEAMGHLAQIQQPVPCAELVARLDTWEEASLLELLRFAVRQGVLLALTVEAYQAS